MSESNSSKVRYVCEGCKKEFFRYPSQAKFTKHFCGDICRRSQTAKRAGTRTCKGCGKQFSYIPYPSHPASQGSFCGRSCRGKAGCVIRTANLPSIVERFWEKVQKIEGGCWLWIGSTDEDGYGNMIATENGKKIYIRAHRLSYEIHFGPIPDGLGVLHRCDVPACVSPLHLFAGTSDDNNKDKTMKDRQAKGEEDGNSKLTEKQVLEIRAKRKEGVSHKELSKLYDTCKANISCILSRRTWKHI